MELTTQVVAVVQLEPLVVTAEVALALATPQEQLVTQARPTLVVVAAEATQTLG